MIISSVEWISESGDEAIVLVSSEKQCLAAFSHPYNRNIGDQVKDYLHPIDVIGLCRSQDKISCASRHVKGLGYNCSGVITDRSNQIIEIDGIYLEIEEDIPKDLFEGEFIQFSCSRIDIW